MSEESRNTQIDRATTWLNHLLMTQEKFRKFAEDTASRMKKPHIKAYLEAVADRARGHEELACGLIRAIGREPSAGRSLAGTVLAKGSELVADIVGLGGGAHGTWKDLRQLHLANQDAIGAFAIAEQLGYDLALPELAEPAFRVQHEKMEDQLLIMEYMLEMGPVAILMHEDA